MAKKSAATAPAPKEGQTPEQTFALFHKNLDEIRLWYHLQADQGREIGHNVILELCMGHVVTALECALKGKKWEPV